MKVGMSLNKETKPNQTKIALASRYHKALLCFCLSFWNVFCKLYFEGDNAELVVHFLLPPLLSEIHDLSKWMLSLGSNKSTGIKSEELCG